MNQITDAELLKEFSLYGRHAAFRTLVQRHGPMVHAVALRVLSNHHDAQDVTQAVFLVLARESAKLCGNPSVAGWLHTVTRRAALDAHKSRESRMRREKIAMKEEWNSTSSTSLSTGFSREVDAALARLPDRYRLPLVLFHLEGASLEAVAQQLNLQPSTLRTRLSRARDMLRQSLGRRGVEVASVGVLTGLFSSEAQSAIFSPTLMSQVLDTATSGGVGATSSINELARNITKANISTTATITTTLVFMKTKITVISGMIVLIAAIGTTATIIQKKDDHNEKISPTSANLTQTNSLSDFDEKRTKTRARGTKNKQSIDEADHALMSFDLTPLMGSKGKEEEECKDALFTLLDSIPESYFGTLLRRMRERNAVEAKLAEDQGKRSGYIQNELFHFIREMAIYREWGKVNFDAALADLSQITDEKTHLKALSNVFIGAMDNDPHSTITKAVTMEINTPGEFSDVQRTKMIDSMYDYWTETDPASAVEWVKQSTFPKERRDQWISDGLREWQKTDPTAAAAWRAREGQ